MSNTTIHSLPDPAVNQAYCDVSALEAGNLKLEFAHFTSSAVAGEVSVAPSLAFLLQHSTKSDKFLFDLGLRKDWHNYSPDMAAFVASVPQDVVESLGRGGLSPSDISTICISHVHFDHMGDISLFPDSTFLLGERTKHVIGPEHIDPLIAKDPPLPPDRTQFLYTADWQPLGPFPRALDYYGDGSLYIVDASGHLAGHLNVMARTSADGAWIYLAGDSAHHWDLVTGKGEIPVHYGEHGFARCAYANKKETERHLSRMRELLAIPHVRVMLAHDYTWYNANKEGGAFWPGKIPSF
ncbi:hypothetical protein C0991_006493 [Blastosporella zonata]|nr:hypothetical protein C0991_006493 [Blastosporella zonata]